MSYGAIISTIRTRPHPNADRVQLGTICGEQVVVGLDVQDGDTMVYFPEDGQLSEVFFRANEEHLSYFGKNRRVRAQNFRGEKSFGFACPTMYLLHAMTLQVSRDTGATTPAIQMQYPEGSFTEVTSFGHTAPICNKYVTPATRQAGAKNQAQRKYPKGETLMFKRHFDTPNARHHDRELERYTGPFVITEKVHGTSQRYGHVLHDVELPLWKRLVNKLAPVFPEQEWGYLLGTRRVIKGDDTDGFYGAEEFRRNVVEGIELRKGETLYFEVCGYTETGAPIMPSQSTKVLKNKDFMVRYGEKMNYTYGCAQGQARIFVYRITITTVDGHSVDLSWHDVKKRCGELGLEHVPEMFAGYQDQTMQPGVWGDAMLQARSWSQHLSQYGSKIDQSHMGEGVVLRTDEGTYKLKAHEFLVMEGHTKDREDYVDTEEVS